MEKLLSNIKINKESGVFEIEVNPKIYSLDVIYSASYVFLDRAYILLKGDTDKKIVVEMKPKKEDNKEAEELKKLALEFNNQLLNYASYKELSDKSLHIKHMLLSEVFSGVMERKTVSELKQNLEKPDIKIDDPEGILIPWEEKYGKNKKSKSAGTEKR